jgi:hypothetical protein
VEAADLLRRRPVVDEPGEEAADVSWWRER